MIDDIRETTVRCILSATPATAETKRIEVAKPISEGFAGAEGMQKKTIVIKKAERIDRNAPCPCGSGKKYKKCCGISSADNS